MKIPELDDFRSQSGTAYGPHWWVDPEGAEFTLTIPEGDSMFEPHEESYRFALVVLPDVETLKEKAVEYLARVVDFGRAALAGEAHLLGVHCDARAGKVTVEMWWETNIHAAWSVTFSWREGSPIPYWPVALACRSR